LNSNSSWILCDKDKLSVSGMHKKLYIFYVIYSQNLKGNCLFSMASYAFCSVLQRNNLIENLFSVKVHFSITTEMYFYTKRLSKFSKTCGTVRWWKVTNLKSLRWLCVSRFV
jgi:hypothetical protein